MIYASYKRKMYEIRRNAQEIAQIIIYIYIYILSSISSKFIENAKNQSKTG